MQKLVIDEIYDWICICDGQEFMVNQMTSSMPRLFDGLPKYAYKEARTRREMNEICSYFRDILPEENQECLLYAKILIGRGFGNDVYVNSKSAKRLLSLALAIAFKFVSEIDCQSVNLEMAQVNNLTIEQFNALELQLFSKYNYNFGVTEAEFQSALDKLNEKAIDEFGIVPDEENNADSQSKNDVISDID